MGKAKEGIVSKGFMKSGKKGGFWILQVASEVASEVAHATLEQRAIFILSATSKVAHATSSPIAFFELSGQEL
ncbi:hypothetical protein PIB30_090098, partial [Stylosanthes scabra]|nr:hypothetical protein [Stylosanthes scabra]